MLFSCRRCPEAVSGSLCILPGSSKRGVVTSCIRQTGHLVVRTPQGQMLCWTFGECEELSHIKSGPMI